MSNPVQAYINFKNYSDDEHRANNGTQTTGICIYNQKYDTTQALPAEMSKPTILEQLNKYINVTTGYELKEIPVEDSKVLSDFQKCLGGGEIDNTEELKNCYVIVFQCLKTIGTDNFYSYYCYFKDGESTDNTNAGQVWLLYFANKDNAPIIFKLQDDIKPVFTIKKVPQEGNPTVTTKYYTNINTGNFEISQKQSETQPGVLNYSKIQLKNTSFNLASNETKETPVDIKPLFAAEVAPKTPK